MKHIDLTYNERFLADVPRWGVAPLVQKQSVAEHSFYVSLYTSKLCTYLNCDDEFTAKALHYALRHDMSEVIMSDIPGPSKRNMRDETAYKNFERSINKILGDDYLEHENYSDKDLVSIKRIVKVADLMDERFFVALEEAKGNSLMVHCADGVQRRLFGAIQALVTSDEKKRKLLITIEQQLMKMRNKGFTLIENNSDLKDTK